MLASLAGALVGLPAPRPVGLVPGRALPAVDSTGLPITKAERDTRSYRGIKLSNGIRTVLVSDPDAEMAAASANGQGRIQRDESGGRVGAQDGHRRD